MKNHLYFPTLVLLAAIFSLPILAVPVSVLGQTYTNVSSNINQNCFNFTSNLHIGSRDSYTSGQVSMLQRFLASQGVYSGPVTGYFGPMTFASVVRFQRGNSVSGTGYVGMLTRGAIQSLSCRNIPPNTPVISMLTPSSGIVGSTVTVTGAGFSSDNTVYFGNGVVPHAYSSNGTTLTFNVPQALDPECYFTVPQCMTFAASQLVTPGNYNVSVKNSKGTSNSLTYTVVANNPTSRPQITSISPSYGPVGTTFTITGTGFTNNNIVKFDIGGVARVASSNGTTLTYTVPNYLGYICSYSEPNCFVAMLAKQVTPGSYNVSVENANGLSNTSVFTVSGGSTQVPVISGVSGPTQLAVNQSGTWSVSARDSNNGSLSYSVTWGDENYYPYAMSAARYTSAEQMTTFSHTYSRPGTYTIRFTVTNNVGATTESSITVNVIGWAY